MQEAQQQAQQDQSNNQPPGQSQSGPPRNQRGQFQGQQAPPLSDDSDEQSIDEAVNAAIEDVERGPQPKTPVKEPEAPPRPKASVLASLHRREQELQRKQAEWTKAQQEREAALAEREAVFKTGKYTPFEALKQIGYDDPQKFLEMVAENGGEWSPEQRKIHELEQWKANQERAEQERQRQQKEDNQAREHKQLVDAWHADIAKYTKSSEKWSNSLLAIPGTEQSVFQVIQDHYEQTGERLEYDDACSAVAQNMESELTTAIRTVASNPRGLELIKAYVASLEPQQPKRGKSQAQQAGITPNVRNQTRSDPLQEMDLDTALETAIQAMNRSRQ